MLERNFYPSQYSLRTAVCNCSDQNCINQNIFEQTVFDWKQTIPQELTAIACLVVVAELLIGQYHLEGVLDPKQIEDG